MRTIIIGNSGSGKTTMARRLAASTNPPTPILSLDDIAWNQGAVRRPLDQTIAALNTFIAANPTWIIEGCYADLAAHALPHCTDLRYLNPGTETCVKRCSNRPWEPEKFPTPQAQQEALAHLVEWVNQYDTRTDEFGLAARHNLFNTFTGQKHQDTSGRSDTDDHNTR